MLQWDKLEGKTINDHGNGSPRYEIISTIGTGGAGRVYLANDLAEDRKVAVKAANPDPTMSNADKRFQMEANILSKLNSPYIIKFYDYFVQEGIQMIIMEYVEGISLETKLKKEKVISPDEAMKFTKQLLEALSEVHAHKVYHRDIKPDNIHITIEGNMKLLDFGIVQESDEQNLTKQGSVIGTVSYMSPEIILNPHRKANSRTDVYSVGVMIYELLTGSKPFKAKDGLYGAEKNNDLALNIVRTPAIPPAEMDATIPENLSHFVMRLIDKEPADRYQSAKEALVDLNRVMQGEDVEVLQGYYGAETKDYSMKKQIVVLSSIATAFVVLFIIAILLLFI